MMNGIRTLVRRLRRGTRGQSLVEFALLTPVLMIFVVAVIDFGKMMFTYQVITNAAREGARRAALADESISDSVVLASIKTALNPVIGSDEIQFFPPDEDGACQAMGGGGGGAVLVYGCGWSGAPDTTPDAVVGIEMEYQTILLGRFLGRDEGEEGSFPLRTRMTYRNE
jgi:hypothetical protein